MIDINEFARWVLENYDHKLTLSQARYAEYLFKQTPFVFGAGRPAASKEQISEWVKGYKASALYTDEATNVETES